jgi:hypothetical protein
MLYSQEGGAIEVSGFCMLVVRTLLYRYDIGVLLHALAGPLCFFFLSLFPYVPAGHGVECSVQGRLHVLMTSRATHKVHGLRRDRRRKKKKQQLYVVDWFCREQMSTRKTRHAHYLLSSPLLLGGLYPLHQAGLNDSLAYSLKSPSIMMMMIHGMAWIWAYLCGGILQQSTATTCNK